MENKGIYVSNLDLELKATKILENITLEAPNGQITGIIGRNGSGKTMLLRCILGFVKYQKGVIWIDGQQANRRNIEQNHIGFILDEPGFLPSHNGFNNLKLLADISMIANKAKIRKAMEDVGLDSESRKRVSHYSRGMLQRLGIAQAIMEDSSVIILDEPMNGIDRASVSGIYDLLIGLKEKGRTILMTSHYPEDIDALCQNIYKMDMGHIEKAR